jgi:ubiquinone/menaquinone biosynthesis C-methylase UbiE
MPDEIARIRDAYARRAVSGADDRYSLAGAANRYLYEQRERDILRLLGEHALLPLEGRRVLDVGCGSGGMLRDFAAWGAPPEHLAGIDLLPERVASARSHGDGINYATGNAAALPYAAGSFDIVLLATVLTSVLDEGVRRQIAGETLRVLRRGGAVIWYDFTWNPGNRDVRGIGTKELRRLYRGCRIRARRSTLAPPLSRLLAPRSVALCRLLEAVPLLRSHLLAAIRPADGGDR